jgi:hypothetical protein
MGRTGAERKGQPWCPRRSRRSGAKSERRRHWFWLEVQDRWAIGPSWAGKAAGPVQRPGPAWMIKGKIKRVFIFEFK